MPRELVVIMPVYNEEGAITSVLDEWVAALGALGIDYFIAVRNDGSRDGTGRLLDEYAARVPTVRAYHQSNAGHGPTVLAGYRAHAAEAAWLFQIDSDNEMGPASFGELWRRRNDFDFLIGWRSGRQSPLPRRVLSLVSRLVVRAFYGGGVRDVNAPYRLMRSAAFCRLFAAIPRATFAPNLIVSGYAAATGLRILNHPVPHTNRRTGVVSIRKWKLLKAGLRSFQQTIRFRLSGMPRD